ncbi:DUF3093 family protein [Cellulomonas edaphi]|uniref:DUF3093 family protein n=1 Tax=Cellulomonas edaphi TaxID=3053468 RepID=A0ABT7S4X9_9CELL|nr:DUF3093 family protein [Cellulomons edaphi]MDM7830646.1 DUF3093 family protein [Cellulomons edaphi]
MIRYQERSPGRRAWLVLLGACAVGWAALALAGGGWVLASVLVGMLGSIAALTMWSTGRYGNITLTDVELRAGRARIPLADIQPWGVSREGDSMGGRLVGGAYVQTIGTAVVGLTMRTGENLLVQSRDPAALRAALDDAMATFRAGD